MHPAFPHPLRWWLKARLLLVATALVAALLICGCGASDATGVADADATPAARIGAQTISITELDEWIKQQLLERELRGSEQKLQELRLRELDNLIFERLLENEAQRRGQSSDALLEAEITRRVDEISADAVRRFYEQNREQMSGASFEEMAPQIRGFLEQRAQGEAGRAFLDELRAGAEVAVLIEPLRQQVGASGPARGATDAPVTIVEFSDYQCGFCRRAEATIAALLDAYPERLRFVYRHFPIQTIHPLAHDAARAAHCADLQGRFWDYHERLFQPDAALERAGLEAHASALGLELDPFRRCLSEAESAARVDFDIREAKQLGVQSTPTFFINGIRVEGARPIEDFRKIIDRELEAG